MKNMIQERERALENEFFASRERELLERMRAEAEASAGRAELAKTVCIQDLDLLDSLLAAGVRAETGALLTVVPLVFVAWGDHRMVEIERRAVVQAAHELRVDPSGVASEILEGWLEERPPEKLFTAWKEWIRVVRDALPSDEKERLDDQILSHCRDIAHSAGGFLETGHPIEHGQRDVIQEIEAALQGA